MSDEEPKTYKQQLKNYFYGPPASWDLWLPHEAKSLSFCPESFHSPYEVMTSTDPWLRKMIWELLFGEEPHGGPIKVFFMDKNEENLIIEKSRSGHDERYVIPKPDNQEPGSFLLYDLRYILIDGLFDAMHRFFRVKWSGDFPEFNTEKDAVMRLCLDLKEKYEIFNDLSDQISVDDKGKFHKKEFGIPHKNKRQEVTTLLFKWIDCVYENIPDAFETFWSKQKRRNENNLISSLAFHFGANCPDLKPPDIFYNVAKITLLCNDERREEIWRRDKETSMSKNAIRNLILKEKKRVQERIRRMTKGVGLPFIPFPSHSGNASNKS
jgi:hypothetical protein